MLFGRKNGKEKRAADQQKSLDPVLHVIDTLKEYRTELIQKEVSSLEIGRASCRERVLVPV